MVTENEQGELFETDEVSVIQETDELDAQGVVAFVTSKFKRAEDARFADENRWLRAYRNYRGLYNQTYSLLKLRSLEYLLKLLRLKHLLRMVR